MNLTVTQLLDVNVGSVPTIKKLCAFPPQNKNNTFEDPCNSNNLNIESETSQNSPWRSCQDKALSNSLILSSIFEHLASSDLINCRLVNLIWLDESTRILLSRRALRTRPGYIQKIIKSIRNASFFQLVDLKEILEKSRRFPSSHISISLNNLGSVVPRELQGFLNRHAEKFDELTIGKSPGESDGLDINWKVLSKFIYYRLSHIESLHVEFLPTFFEQDDNDASNSTQDNHDADPNDRGKRKKRKCQYPIILPNLKTVTFRAFLGSRDDFFLNKIIESAPNLQQVELTKLRREHVDPSSLCGHLYAVHLYKLLNSLDRLHLIKYHVFTDSDFIRPFDFVGDKMRLESISFATSFHYPAASPFILLSNILESSKTTLKSIQNLPYHFFSGIQIPNSLVNLKEIHINDAFALVNYALELTETGCEWTNIFPTHLASRLSTTFPSLKKVTINFKPESFQYWKDSPALPTANNSSNSISTSSLPSVTEVILTNEPPPQFLSRLQRLSELFPNVRKLKIGNVCNFPTSAELIWKYFPKLTSLELTLDVGWAFSHGTYSMDYAFIGANGTDENNASILNLKDLKVLKLHFFDSFEITRFPNNDNTHMLLSHWAGENAFRLMSHLKLYISLSCDHDPNFLSWRTALEPLRLYAETFPQFV